jgi:hypothetical protein
MKTKLEAAVLPISLLLLAVLVCPQTVGAQTDHGFQSNSEFPSNNLPLNSANTTETDNSATTTMQPSAENITQQNQLPLMIVIIVAAFAAYIAVIAVLASKKIR